MRDRDGGDRTAFLLPFLAEAATVKAAIDVVAPHFFAGPAPMEVPPSTRALALPTAQYSGEYATLVTPAAGSFSAATLALPGGVGMGTIPRTLLKWLQKYAIIYGPAVASAVWEEFQKRRRGGQTTALAKASIDQAYPEIHTRILRGRRRRMNPANIRALRRALRRVRSFKRVTRKVKGLGLTHRGGGGHYYRRRPRRRGDLWDVEDAADEIDEAEDLGYDGEDFFGEE